MRDFFENDTLRNAAFADFWALIPQGAKSGKAAAQKAFRKLSFNGQKCARDNVAAYYDGGANETPKRHGCTRRRISTSVGGRTKRSRGNARR
jgi:hypothetical protein